MADPNPTNQQNLDAVIKDIEKLILNLQQASESVIPRVHDFVEKGTERVGQIVTPVVSHPWVKYATKVPVIKWLMAILGQVDIQKVKQDVQKLQQEYPLEKPDQLAQRIIKTTVLQASGVGLITNFIPPLALALLPLDLAAVTVLQAEMIYRIAAVYGFSIEDPTRRGEILAIWWLSTNSSGFVKAGFSIFEIIPVVGTFVGVASNAALLTLVGNVAGKYYEEKLKHLKNDISIS
ncbi:hypothetical protein C7H19_08075 [Aphanothece hegewaldii CCALA 016]|uniref:DUF697 domain-containing protein n=1 Tax=Aphanothece hegewaldii CCALA 016 TaxID=2107694 RepID=A0A2T1LZU8_9CHRO|nr:EcsC family protein [Aphanothece hegewaldii]PSF37923.1 hypothetical protein C7H19_08075 [Aphanothece hegewaldii CCALA 016]